MGCGGRAAASCTGGDGEPSAALPAPHQLVERVSVVGTIEGKLLAQVQVCQGLQAGHSVAHVPAALCGQRAEDRGSRRGTRGNVTLALL